MSEVPCASVWVLSDSRACHAWHSDFQRIIGNGLLLQLLLPKMRVLLYTDQALHYDHWLVNNIDYHLTEPVGG